MDDGFILAFCLVATAALLEAVIRIIGSLNGGPAVREAKAQLAALTSEGRALKQAIAEARKAGVMMTRRNMIATKNRKMVEKRAERRRQKSFEAMVELGQPYAGRRLFKAIVGRTSGGHSHMGKIVLNPIWKRDVRLEVWARNPEDARFMVMTRFPATLDYVSSFPQDPESREKDGRGRKAAKP